jgi:hypothetical protein
MSVKPSTTFAKSILHEQCKNHMGENEKRISTELLSTVFQCFLFRSTQTIDELYLSDDA